MPRIKFTDMHRWQTGYADANRTNEPGYLAKRFQEIRERQKLEAEAKAAKVCGEIKPKIRGKA